MPVKQKKISIESAHYVEILTRLENLSSRVEEMQRDLLSRKHLDEKIAHHEEMFIGNGKPGWHVIRDKVLSWDSKMNALTLLVAGNIIWQIIERAL